MSTKRPIRCAIYTRKSTEEGLEQDFNSLDAQREACEAYVTSQKAEGWIALAGRYDDGGYSGGTLERPALKRLLAEIEAGSIDVVVVYKIDRLSRSLMDFSKLVELFDRKSVTFVSVTQSFNTTTSMGRLTLNVLLSFAQFEREVTGERIRDKIAASKRKGIWMGGLPPLGYDVGNRKLVVNSSEAETVQRIFRRYLELGCVRLVCDDLAAHGTVSKQRTFPNGKTRGGVALDRSAVGAILKNRVYIGLTTHKDAAYRGEHEPIVTQELFDAVQKRLAEQAPNLSGKARAI
jgi:DNA invertase Pin-like site-specific DNA recombinase